MKKIRPLYIWITGTCIVILSVFIFIKKEDTASPRYRFGKIETGQIKKIVTSSGEINPLNSVIVGSQISGMIKEIYVDYNSPVKKDHLIALIDNDIYAAQVEQAEAQLYRAQTQLQENEKDIIVAKANIESAKANLASAEASYQLANIQYDRLKALSIKQIAAQSELDVALKNRQSALSAVDIAKTSVQTAQARLQQVMAQKDGISAVIKERLSSLRLAKIRLEYCYIRSPIDGIVISKNIEPGQTVAATLQSPTLFVISENLSQMQLEVDVSESDIGQIQTGQEIEFSVDAFPEKIFKAFVKQVRNTPTNIQNVITYKIIGSVQNENQMLRPGMTANVSIIIAMVDNVLKVPNAALRVKIPEAESPKSSRESAREVGKKFIKRLTKELDLDKDQSRKLVALYVKEGTKIRDAMQSAGEEMGEANRTDAMRNFFKNVLTQFRQNLSPDQDKKLIALLKELQKERQNMATGRATAKLYNVDEDGALQTFYIQTGIANEMETQIFSQDLEAGDQVIVGLIYTSEESASGGFGSGFLRGRR